MDTVGCIAYSQRLYAVFERPSKVSVTPEEISPFFLFSKNNLTQFFLPLVPFDTIVLSVAALPSTDTPRPTPAVAALLNASGSEDSHRGPYQEA